MTDVQRLSSLYDATKSKLLENETYSQVLLHCSIGVLVAGVPVTAASADCSCPGRPCSESRCLRCLLFPPYAAREQDLFFR